MSFLDKLIYGFVYMLPFIPVVTPLACIFLDVDAIYVILDRFVLTNPYYRSNAATFTHMLLRSLFYGIASADIARGMVLIGMVLVFSFNRLISLLKFFQRRWSNSNRFVMVYRRSYFAAVCILTADWEKMLYAVFQALFWLIVGSVWFVVMNSPSDVSYPLYMGVVLVASISCLAFTVVSHIICTIFYKSQYSINAQKFVVKYRYAKHPSMEKRRLRRELDLLLPIQMHFGTRKSGT